MLGRILIATVSLVLGVLVALIIQEARWAEAKPKIRTEDEATIYGWPSAANLREDIVDKDRDGTPEHWSISAWGNSEKGLSYWFFDEDDDGQAEDVMALFGVSPNATSLHHLDLDEDGSPEAWQLILPTENDSSYWYVDNDGDGRFDTMSNAATGEQHVLVDLTWAAVIDPSDKLPREKCTVTLDGEPTPLEFRDHRWQRAE